MSSFTDLTPERQTAKLNEFISKIKIQEPRIPGIAAKIEDDLVWAGIGVQSGPVWIRFEDATAGKYYMIKIWEARCKIALFGIGDLGGDPFADPRKDEQGGIEFGRGITPQVAIRVLVQRLLSLSKGIWE